VKLQALLSYAWAYRVTLALCSLLLLLDSAAALLVPWLGGRLGGSVLAGGYVDVNGILLLLLILFAFQGLIRFASGYVLSGTAEQILANLRIRIYDHLQALPISFYHRYHRGEILALITYEVAQLSAFLTGTLLSLIPFLLTIVGALLLMFRIDFLL